MLYQYCIYLRVEVVFPVEEVFEVITQGSYGMEYLVSVILISGSVAIDVRVMCGSVAGSADVDSGVFIVVGTSTMAEKESKFVKSSTYDLIDLWL